METLNPPFTSPRFEVAGPVYWHWRADGLRSAGVFPVAHFSNTLNWAGPFWLRFAPLGVDGGGIFPLLCFTGDFSAVAPAYWRHYEGEWSMAGFFPLFQWSDGGMNYAGPVFWNAGGGGMRGVFPFYLRSPGEWSVIGPYFQFDRGGAGIFPLGYYQHDECLTTLNLGGFLWHSRLAGSGGSYFHALWPFWSFARDYRDARPGWSLWPLATLDRGEAGFFLPSLFWNRFERETPAAGCRLPDPETGVAELESAREFYCFGLAGSERRVYRFWRSDTSPELKAGVARLSPLNGQEEREFCEKLALLYCDTAVRTRFSLLGGLYAAEGEPGGETCRSYCWGLFGERMAP